MLFSENLKRRLQWLHHKNSQSYLMANYGPSQPYHLPPCIKMTFLNCKGNRQLLYVFRFYPEGSHTPAHAHTGTHIHTHTHTNAIKRKHTLGWGVGQTHANHASLGSLGSHHTLIHKANMHTPIQTSHKWRQNKHRTEGSSQPNQTKLRNKQERKRKKPSYGEWIPNSQTARKIQKRWPSQLDK